MPTENQSSHTEMAQTTARAAIKPSHCLVRRPLVTCIERLRDYRREASGEFVPQLSRHVERKVDKPGAITELQS